MFVKNEAGNQYDRLTAIKEAGRDKGGAALWECQCSCGKKTIVRGGDLRSGHIRSCGCTKGGRNIIKEKEGTRYGKLVVLEYAGKSKGGDALWWCQCDCGKKTIASGSKLRSNHTKSCGCLQKLPNGEAAFNAILRNTQRGAKRRGHKWELSTEQVRKLINMPCFYCGILPSTIWGTKTYRKCNGDYSYNGIDRIDNSKGYTIDNVVTCCVECNRAKLARPVSNFLDWLRRIIMHNKWDYKNIDTAKFIKNKNHGMPKAKEVLEGRREI